MKYRGKHEIYQAMLETCNDSLGANRTRIMYGAELSWGQVQDYMDSVINKGLIEERKKRYFLTQKGRETLNILIDLHELLHDGP